MEFHAFLSLIWQKNKTSETTGYLVHLTWEIKLIFLAFLGLFFIGENIVRLYKNDWYFK